MIFVFVLVALELGACGSYAWHEAWPESVMWLGAAVANGAWLWKAL